MLQGLYAAASGLVATDFRQDVIAKNLAHVNVPGFRREIAPMSVNEQTSAELAGVATDPITTDFTPGPMTHTGRTLDVAIHGDGFFVVEGPDGPLYTRNGVFQMDAGGNLVTSSGLAVQGVGGNITMPPDAAPSSIQIGIDGTITSGETQIGQLQIVSFEDNQQLQTAGTTLFAAPPGVEAGESTATVEQGARELSNVHAVDELVQMIVGMRQHDASQRALRALADTIQQNTDPRQ